jgi:glucuronosyltransferase
MEKTSALFKDRPRPPIEEALWWIDYVLRHDTSSLRPLAIQQTWLQRRLLDVWLSILLVIAIVLALVFSIKSILRFCISFSFLGSAEKLSKGASTAFKKEKSGNISRKVKKS